MIRILYITHSTQLYGASRSLIDIIKYLDKSTYEVYVIVPDRGELTSKLFEMGVKYKIVKLCQSVHYESENVLGLEETIKKAKINYQAIKQIIKYIDYFKIDIVHSNVSVVNIGALAALIKNKPHIQHVRELPVQFRYKKDFPLLDHYIFTKSSKVICISKYIRSEVRKDGKYNNLELCYNPIDIEKYIIDRKEYFADKDIQVLVSGAISENKGQLDVVKAIGLLIKRGCTNIKLIIVGNGVYSEKIQKYIHDNKLEGYVSLFSFTDNIELYRMSADIAIMSSVYEALGRVTIESMLGELAVIGADSGATSELIKDGYTGLKYEPHNIEQLENCIEYVVQNKEKTIEMIHNAKRFAIRKFEARKQVKKIERIYSAAFQNKLLRRELNIHC